MAEKYNCPEAVAAALIYNDKGEVFLIKNAKWGDAWQIPGGHIELGETAEEALKREIMEETGYEIDNIEFACAQTAINPPQYHRRAHFVFLDYFARLAGGKLLESSDEMDENIWVKPEEALKMKLNRYTKQAVEKFIKRREKKDYEELYKRALADYQNLLKRTAEEKIDCAKYANERLIQEILPVYDNMKLALMHSNGGKDAGAGDKKDGAGNGGQVEEGIKLVLRQFKNILEEEGLSEIETVGKTYDHNSMEAMGYTETDDKKKDGIVAEELKPGYKLKGKVIVPARVKVYEFKK